MIGIMISIMIGIMQAPSATLTPNVSRVTLQTKVALEVDWNLEEVRDMLNMEGRAA